jgi:hypothetical protein
VSPAAMRKNAPRHRSEIQSIFAATFHGYNLSREFSMRECVGSAVWD